MEIELSDEEAAALLALLNRAIDDDRYPLSPRIRTLRGIRAKFPAAPPEPPPARPPNGLSGYENFPVSALERSDGEAEPSKRGALVSTLLGEAASPDKFPALFRRDALPGDLAVFLAFTDAPRRRNKDHTGRLKAHPAHLIGADAARV